MQFDVVSDEPNLPAELLSSEALTVLLDTLGTGQYAQANAPLVKKLFRSQGLPKPVHCHRRKREVEPTLLAQYRCAVLMLGGSCKATAVYRHVPKPKRGATEAYSELLLLSVAKAHQSQGIGTALTAYVKQLSFDAGSAYLLVISGRPTVTFWQRPQQGFIALAKEEEAAPQYASVFVPWSDGITILKYMPLRQEGAARQSLLDLAKRQCLVIAPAIEKAAAS